MEMTEDPGPCPCCKSRNTERTGEIIHCCNCGYTQTVWVWRVDNGT